MGSLLNDFRNSIFWNLLVLPKLLVIIDLLVTLAPLNWFLYCFINDYAYFYFCFMKLEKFHICMKSTWYEVHMYLNFFVDILSSQKLPTLYCSWIKLILINTQARRLGFGSQWDWSDMALVTLPDTTSSQPYPVSDWDVHSIQCNNNTLKPCSNMRFMMMPWKTAL